MEFLAFFVIAVLFLWIYLSLSKKSLKDFLIDLKEVFTGGPKVVYEEAQNKFSAIR